MTCVGEHGSPSDKNPFNIFAKMEWNHYWELEEYKRHYKCYTKDMKNDERAKEYNDLFEESQVSTMVMRY